MNQSAASCGKARSAYNVVKVLLSYSHFIYDPATGDDAKHHHHQPGVACENVKTFFTVSTKYKQWLITGMVWTVTAACYQKSQSLICWPLSAAV